MSFDAYSVAPRAIIALVGKNSAPWTLYSGTQQFALTTSKQTFSYSFIMNAPTDIHSRLGFDIGASSADVYFDNVTLSKGETVTNLNDDKIAFDEQFYLHQNYPNPFNPSTKIRYSIPANVKREMSNVVLKVYDVLGNEVATLVNEEKSIGVYEVIFDASQLTSGIYFYKLQTASFVETRKMILLK